MAEELTFISGSKEEQYLSLLPQVKALIEGKRTWLPIWLM